MADRRGGPQRGRGGSRGPSDRGHRGRGRGGGGAGGNGPQTGSGTATQVPTAADKKRENILDLNKYMDKEIRVRFNGGREVTGLLKGFDQLMNLVLDNVKERTQGEFSFSSCSRSSFPVRQTSRPSLFSMSRVCSLSCVGKLVLCNTACANCQQTKKGIHRHGIWVCSSRAAHCWF